MKSVTEVIYKRINFSDAGSISAAVCLAKADLTKTREKPCQTMIR
jgi:hypothetical protein